MKRPHIHHAERGVGLVEVLVAVLVLSIGLLGLAGLQLRTMRNNESSLERGVAVAETHAIADAMRADRANAVNLNTYNIALGAAVPTGTTFRDRAIAAWLTNLTSSLGSGATGSIACNGASCQIIVQWDNTRATAGTTTGGDILARSDQQLVTWIQL